MSVLHLTRMVIFAIPQRDYFFRKPVGQVAFTAVIFLVMTPLIQVIVIFFGATVGVGVGFGVPMTIGFVTAAVFMS